MPKVTGLEFARTIPKSTLVIFTTAYAEYAIDSYEVDAVDYLVKPIVPERFRKAVEKAEAYHALLPKIFLRVNRSYIINTCQIASFDNNDIYIDKYKIAIGNNYRDIFFDEFVAKMGKA